MEKYLYILRSVSGAGKSLLASTLSDNICCADDYHMDDDGNYNWKQENQHKAHRYSQNLCKEYMEAGKEKIVIANTNTSNKEMKPYEVLAKKYGYTIFHLVVENRHGNTDVHDVPADVKARQSERIMRNIKLK